MIVVDRITATPDPLNTDRYLVSVFWKTERGILPEAVVHNDDTSLAMLGSLPSHLGYPGFGFNAAGKRKPDGSRGTKG